MAEREKKTNGHYYDRTGSDPQTVSIQMGGEKILKCERAPRQETLLRTGGQRVGVKGRIKTGDFLTRHQSELRDG